MKTRSGKKQRIAFAGMLLQWDRTANNRMMPWKGEKDPYKIWLSEIILQQTRVDQGLQYYHDFINTFPDIHQLANADDQRVFKLWEGLGYYSRCKNLLITARYISSQLDGSFPDSYDDLVQLKGVGSYTASAIASFAYNLPFAVVDGNVFRVIARIYGIDKPTDTTEGKKFFASLANELLDKNEPGRYNQAIMDFGATVCKPANPLCHECIFNKDCYAFLHQKTTELPVKAKKGKITKRWLNYIVITFGNELLIYERREKDIWQHLFEFTLIETQKAVNVKSILRLAITKHLLPEDGYLLISHSGILKQQLSHQLINGQFVQVKLLNKSAAPPGGQWIKKAMLKKHAFPQFINQFLKENI